MYDANSAHNAIESDDVDDVKERHLLEDFVVDNPELQSLESSLSKFNIFESLGVINSELRNSDFLAFLLNPEQNHGLGDSFLKPFLQSTLLSSRNKNPDINPIDIDIWDLGDTEIQREWQNIDILITNRRLKILFLIENKLDSTEHSDQLQRYLTIVAQHYPDYIATPILLSKENLEPSDDRYIPIDYSLILDVLQSLIAVRRSTLGTEVIITIEHYNEMLRRHIVTDSEIAKLSQQIYRKHHTALDIIFEHRPDSMTDIAAHLHNITEANTDLDLLNKAKTMSPFLPKQWYQYPILKQGHDKNIPYLLKLEWTNRPTRLSLYLVLCPGPQNVRQDLWTQLEPLHSQHKRYKKLNRMWNYVWQKTFLSKTDLENQPFDVLTQKIDTEWQNFLSVDLPYINEIVGTIAEDLQTNG